MLRIYLKSYENFRQSEKPQFNNSEKQISRTTKRRFQQKRKASSKESEKLIPVTTKSQFQQQRKANSNDSKKPVPTKAKSPIPTTAKSVVFLTYSCSMNGSVRDDVPLYTHRCTLRKKMKRIGWAVGVGVGGGS